MYNTVLLGLNFDCLRAIGEVTVLVSQGSASGVNLPCPKFVPEVLLQFVLAGTHDSVDKKYHTCELITVPATLCHALPHYPRMR